MPVVIDGSPFFTRHQVVDAEVGVNCVAIPSEVLAQPLFSVRTVRDHLV